MKKLSWKVLAPVSIIGMLALGAGAYIFQPWKLFVDTEVQESLPTVQQTPEAATEPSEEQASPTEPVSTEPVLLAEGTLISHEYETSGQVKILQLVDGSRVLRLENLDTSDGPKVELWLTDAPVIEGEDGWRVFDDGRYESLGAMKGNKGNQNYKIPDDLDLSEFTSVSLWCVTFSVSFGAAELVLS
jgi:hypothetical protein